jgi:DNA-directed RNA polymerase
MQQISPIDYIKISIANAYGLDKLSWDNRIHWAEQVLANKPTRVQDFINSADEPLLMEKGINAYYDANNGEPTGFIMGLDATASGIQIMSCMIGCDVTAKAVNLVDTGKREDVYTEVANHMNMERGAVKPSVMTHFYGSKAGPKAAFGDELNKFHKAMAAMLPGACECMVDMQECWQPNVLKHEWHLPDGHTASVKVMSPIDKKIEIDEMDHATFTHRAYINEAQESGLSLAANIIHSIDGYVVREMYRMANEQNFELLTIHDSFWASPNYIQNVRENYVSILARLADSNLMEDILVEITDNPALRYTKRSTGIGHLVRQAEYALS